MAVLYSLYLEAIKIFSFLSSTVALQILDIVTNDKPGKNN